MDMNFTLEKKTAARIEVPEPNRKDASGISCPYSETIEQFYDSLDRHLSEAEESGVPIIYVVDSMDSLSSEAEFKKVKENASARLERERHDRQLRGRKSKDKFSKYKKNSRVASVAPIYTDNRLPGAR